MNWETNDDGAQKDDKKKEMLDMNLKLMGYWWSMHECAMMWVRP